MGILSAIFKKKTQEPAQTDKKTVRHSVAGTSFRQDAILAMGKKNPDFALTKRDLFKRGRETPVYEYTFNPKKAELVPEPENPHDPNAIKVLVDGVHVGYIKSGSCAHLLKVIREDRIEKIEVRIFGGKSKCLTTYDADAKRLEDYELVKDSSPFGVSLQITETKKPEA